MDEYVKKCYEDIIIDLMYYMMYNKRCLLVFLWGKKLRIMEVKKDLRILVLNFNDVIVVNIFYFCVFDSGDIINLFN